MAPKPPGCNPLGEPCVLRAHDEWGSAADGIRLAADGEDGPAHPDDTWTVGKWTSAS